MKNQKHFSSYFICALRSQNLFEFAWLWEFSGFSEKNILFRLQFRSLFFLGGSINKKNYDFNEIRKPPRRKIREMIVFQAQVGSFCRGKRARRMGKNKLKRCSRLVFGIGGKTVFTVEVYYFFIIHDGILQLQLRKWIFSRFHLVSRMHSRMQNESWYFI